MKQLILILTILLFGCGSKEHDKKIVKDSNGNIYKLEWRIGSCYVLEKIDANEVTKLSKDTIK